MFANVKDYIIHLIHENFQSDNMLSEFNYSEIRETIYEKFSPLDRNSQRYRDIKSFFNYSRVGLKISIDNIFTVKPSRKSICELKNRKLLWHGTPSRNVPNILSEGLNMKCSNSGECGRGLYFTEIVEKAAIYSSYFDTQNKEGLLLLCDVALGNPEIHVNPIFKEGCDAGKDSVYVMGKIFMKPEKTLEIDGATAEYGRIIENPLVKSDLADKYNEMVVYNDHQVDLKYLIHFSFNSQYSPDP